jgi:hypothetical protein
MGPLPLLKQSAVTVESLRGVSAEKPCANRGKLVPHEWFRPDFLATTIELARPRPL